MKAPAYIVQFVPAKYVVISIDEKGRMTIVDEKPTASAANAIATKLQKRDNAIAATTDPANENKK